MARGRGKGSNSGNGHAKKRPIERYEHKDKKRVNNPPVDLGHAGTRSAAASTRGF